MSLLRRALSSALCCLRLRLKALLASAGVSVTETRLARSIDEAAAHAAELGYPVALKMVSDEITHKTDFGGVELGVADEDALRAACQRIHERVIAAVPDAQAQGVSVQAMAEQGVEVILGITQDQQFGPELMFGLGEVFVEIAQGCGVPDRAAEAARCVGDGAGDPGVPDPGRGSRSAVDESCGDRVDAAATLGVCGGAPRDRGARPEPGVCPAGWGDCGGCADSVDFGLLRRTPMAVTRERLTRALAPKVVAVIGDKQASGYNWLRSMKEFDGPVYSVQVDENEIPGIEELGIPNYKSLTEYSGPG